VIPIAEAIRLGASLLGGEDGARESRILLAHALGATREALIAEPGRLVDPAPFLAMVERRRAREPIARIVGRKGFWTLDLEVSGASLVPRPDSETVVEAALDAAPSGPCRVLDLGTGTGCLLLAVLSELPGAWGVGVDREPEAALLAARNADAAGLAERAAFLAGDWADAVAGRFDLVLSNPPYIPSGDIAGLMPDVALHEPRLALDGGADGLDAYRAILPALDRLLAPGGAAVLECGIGQSSAIAAMAHGWSVDIHRDLAGIERALRLRRPF
jgi:release factor glutamine methyltransferase